MIDNKLVFLYAYHPTNNGNPTDIKYFEIDQNGNEQNLKTVPNPNNLLIVKDFTMFNKDHSVFIIGKKGILGKASKIEKIKLY